MRLQRGGRGPQLPRRRRRQQFYQPGWRARHLAGGRSCMPAHGQLTPLRPAATPPRTHPHAPLLHRQVPVALAHRHAVAALRRHAGALRGVPAVMPHRDWRDGARWGRQVAGAGGRGRAARRRGQAAAACRAACATGSVRACSTEQVWRGAPVSPTYSSPCSRPSTAELSPTSATSRVVPCSIGARMHAVWAAARRPVHGAG